MVDRIARRCSATDQIAAVDELSLEENNLADVLRRAMADDDAAPPSA